MKKNRRSSSFTEQEVNAFVRATNGDSSVLQTEAGKKLVEKFTKMRNSMRREESLVRTRVKCVHGVHQDHCRFCSTSGDR